MIQSQDTIAAVATAPGRGGGGIEPPAAQERPLLRTILRQRVKLRCVIAVLLVACHALGGTYQFGLPKTLRQARKASDFVRLRAGQRPGAAGR